MSEGEGMHSSLLAELAMFAGSFVGLAIVCDDHMVVALETLCVRWNIPEDVAGASFLAIGSAAPEIVINAIGVYKAHKAGSGGQSTSPEAQREANSALQLGLSAIIGSGMIAFLLAPAICALGAKQILKLKRRPLAKNILFYVLSLVALCWFFMDGIVTISESTVMLIIYAGYILVTFFGPMGAWRKASTPDFGISCVVGFLRALTTALPISSTAMRKYTVWKYGPLPRDMVQQNFVEQRREEQRLQQSSELTSVGGDGSMGGMQTETDADEDDDDTPADFFTIDWWMALLPRFLRLIFSYTCPDCSEGSRYESWYPVTLGTSFIWVTFFSGTISDIVGAWEEKLGVSTIILGITLVAVGGEVPDTIQSLAVAKKGYGSLAVANCLGAQVANIGFGLGLPWFLSALWDEPVVLNGHAEVQTLVWFHVAGISIFTFITLGLVVAPLLYAKPLEPKATLTPAKGLVLIVSYIIIICSYVVTCQLNDAMSLKISFGATQMFALILLGGLAAAAWTSRRMRLRHRAELRKAGLLPEQMEAEFYRMKLKREGGNGGKVKQTPPNTAHATPNSTPLRGGGNGSSSFSRLGGTGDLREDNCVNGYDDEVSWDEEAEEEIHPSTAAAMAIAQANGDVNELQDAVANIQRQAHARARAKGMSSGYAAMSNSLLRKALRAPRR